MKLFWKKVAITDNGCWEWQGSRLKKGYGHFATWNGERHTFMAHRLAWTLWYGEDPGEKCVLHKCDNPPCVNPSHLFLGTQRENMRDKLRKGRDHNMRRTHCKYGHPFTEENTFTTDRNTRECRTCRRASSRAYKLRVKTERDALKAKSY